MKRAFGFGTIEKSVVDDKRLLYTIASYSAVLAIFANLSSLQSPFIGPMMSIIYFVINALFLGNALVKKEEAFFRFMFGMLSLILLLGFVGWLTLIIYNLDIARVTLVLLAVATLSSLLNMRMKNRNGQK